MFCWKTILKYKSFSLPIQISSSPGDLLKLAFSTQILTSQPEQLSADNITTAAQIANTLLQSANITEVLDVLKSSRDYDMFWRETWGCYCSDMNTWGSSPGFDYVAGHRSGSCNYHQSAAECQWGEYTGERRCPEVCVFVFLYMFEYMCVRVPLCVSAWCM